MSVGMPSDLLILDGGCGNELKKRKAEGHNVAYNSDLFSSAALLETPQGIIDLHRDYVLAGANVISTASYATTRFYLDKVGRGGDVAQLAALTVELARKGIEEAGRVLGDAKHKNKVLVAAVVPPLNESFRADLVPSDAELREQYNELIPAMNSADVYLCETISNMREASMSVPMCLETGKPVWTSFTLEPVKTGDSITGVRLGDGTSVSDAVETVLGYGVDAILFNCAAPELIDLALPFAREVLNKHNKSHIPLGAYANFWEVCDRTGWTISQNESEYGKGDQGGKGMVVRADLSAEPYAMMTESWCKNYGANIIGGCCGIGPGHIKCVSERLRAKKGASSRRRLSAREKIPPSSRL